MLVTHDMRGEFYSLTKQYLAFFTQIFHYWIFFFFIRENASKIMVGYFTQLKTKQGTSHDKVNTSEQLQQYSYCFTMFKLFAFSLSRNQGNNSV